MQAAILLGAPGAGKGTAAESVTEQTDFVHVSTGNMLREELKAGSALGREARAYMDKGELVPDDVIMRIVTARLESGAPDARYVFDGFPRTLEQARLLGDVLASHGARLLCVFLLEVPEALVVDRMSGRRICRECGAVYHIRNIPPRREGVCDHCGGELYQRDDDAEETVRNRLAVFRKQTGGLIDYYQRMGLLVRVDARDRELTTQQMLRHLPGGGSRT